MSIQSTIDSAAETLSPSLARVANFIRARPVTVVDSTINELAALCETSVASVVRFCRAIGFSGYAQLRMALASELGKESGSDQLMIDATHLKAHRTAASLLKGGLYPDVSDAAGAG